MFGPIGPPGKMAGEMKPQKTEPPGVMEEVEGRAGQREHSVTIVKYS